MKILVVDDNATNRKFLRVLLTQEGHTVVEGNDGIEALEILEREQIDAVISDILMPRMDGYRLCYEIRKNPELNPTLFIAYTAAYTSPRDERLALDFGADRFLPKPALPEAIIKALHEAAAPRESRIKKPREPDELSAMKEYSEVLVQKLEETNSQLSQANEALNERAVLAEFNAEVSNALNRKDTLPGTLRLCAAAMVHHLDAAFARIWTYNKNDHVLELQASAGMYTHLNGGHARVPVGQFKIGLIASERKPHLTNSVIGDPRVNDQQWAKREGMIAFAGYPLLVEDRLVGVMAMFARKPLSQNTLAAMESVAKAIAAGIERKVTENELRQSDERFRELAENIREIFFISGPDGTPVHYVSPAFEEISGRSRKGFEGNPGFWLELIHPDDRERVGRAHRTAPERLSSEYRMVRPDGSIRWIHARSFPVQNDAGTTVRLVGIAEDITDRKRAEEKVRQNLERIRALHEIAAAISSTLDLRTVLNVLLEKIEIFLPIAAATTVRLLNDQTGELESLACRGLDEDEWKSQPVRTLTGRAKRIVETKAPLAVRNIQRDARTYNAKIFAKHNLVSYLGVPLIAKEKVLGVLGLYTNEEHQFTDGEVEFLTTLADQAAIAIHNARLYAEADRSKKDLETTNQYLDRSLRQLDGLYTALTPLSPSTSIRETTEGILDRLIEATGADAALIRVRDRQSGTYEFSGHRGFPAAYLKQVETIPAGGSVEWVVKHREPIISPDIASDARFKGKIQVRLGFHSAAMLPFEVREEVRGIVHIASRKPAYFDDQQRHHLMAIARQMGIAFENKELYENLRTSKDELEKALKVKDDFLSVISHELKTPLIVLMEYANVLKDGVMGRINEDQEKSLVRLLDAAAEQLKMINMILQTTQIESHALTSEHHFVEIADLLHKLQGDYVSRAKDKGLELIGSCPAEPIAIFSDSAKLSQILRNLVDNAIKFTEEGCVTISVRKHEDNGTIEFRVTDTGIGIATDMQSAIFEKLYQADSSATRDYGGLGLGLYIVKKYCDLLGANIKVESAVGKGSTFTVAIPMNRP